MAGFDFSQSANPILIAGRGHGLAEHGSCGALGLERSSGTSDRVVFTGDGLSGRGKETRLHVLGQSKCQHSVYRLLIHQLPFAEDEHNFWFPSLTTYKTSAGKVIEEHPLLPTAEQCDLMDELVDALDLDAYATNMRDEEKAARKAAEEDVEDENEEEMEDQE